MGTTRQSNVDGQEFFSYPMSLPTISATTTFALFTAQRPYRIDAIEIIVDTTYTADPALYYSMAVQVGGRTTGTWSTQTSAQGAIAGGTPAAVPLAAESGQNRVAAKGDVVTFVATKNSTAANITPRVVIHGRYVG
jgi:hypothetical protein